MKKILPKNHQPYADKYFLRSNEILRAECLNPWVRAQVFIRQGPGFLAGIDEALQILSQYSPLVQYNGRVYSLREYDTYYPKETLMLIEAPIQDIVELQTMYLGVISAETTKINDHDDVNLDDVKATMKEVVEAAKGKPVSYFGARHWRYDADEDIARAAFEAGASSTSTDIGAAAFNQKGIGTIPHDLENIYAWQFGYDRAVVEATKAFDRVIQKEVPRIALVDYANREIDDAIKTAIALDGNLKAVRVDTCGENTAQGAIEFPNKRFSYPKEHEKYWFGTGVTITGVYALRQLLNAAGFQDVKIMLSSGFGNPEKVRAFVEAENYLGIKLFDSLGVGGVFPSRMATMDVVAVGSSLENMIPMSKVGRSYKPNSKLELRLGGKK